MISSLSISGERMYRFFYISFIFSLMACSFQPEVESSEVVLERIERLEIPSLEIQLQELFYDNQTSQWLKNGKPYSGMVEETFPNGQLKQKFGVLNGKKQDSAYSWFPDGQLLRLEYYHQNKLHGKVKSWYPGKHHFIAKSLNYHLGKVHGTQLKWYDTGEVYQILNLNLGKEEGLQKAFRKNGDLYANYEARNGRTFGMKRSMLCYELENEVVQYSDN